MMNDFFNGWVEDGEPLEYTTERTIAFFSIGEEHMVTKELAREIAADLEAKQAEIERLQRSFRPPDFVAFNALKAENERLRAAIQKAVDEDDSYWNVTSELAKALEGKSDE